jgi:LuxR family maltose regulon positive regulatory protein
MRTADGGAPGQPEPRADDDASEAPATSLLVAKLLVPRLPGRLVQRQRLFELLDAGVRGPVTLVSAQAGAGKTVLLSSWSASARLPGPVAWLSLEAEDDDPTRFWTNLLATLRRSGAVPGRSPLRARVPARAGPRRSFPLLLAGGLAQLPQAVVVVLDDFHVITQPEILEGMDLLLRSRPPPLRLVLATRSDPTLPLLPRLRLSGELVEARAADLAFTTGETSELLASHDVRLPDADLALLQARTEGWAAGLRLAALSFQDRPDPSQAVAAFAGTDRTVADYLVAEVLDRLPGQVRSFLLRTCIVDRISGELANALTGGTDGELTLARLERANAFVVAFGPGRAWYRYHHLFAGLLRYELRRQAPEAVPELHRRAARWYAGHGFPLEATRHALDGGDWDGGVELVVDHGLDLALGDETATIGELVERLPRDLVRANPELGALLAFDRLDLIDHDEATAYLDLARRQRHLVPEGRRERFALVAALLELVIARQWGLLEEVRTAGRELVALQARSGAQVVASAQDKDLRTVALLHLGAAELWTGRLDAAEPHLEEARAEAEQTRLGHAQLQSLSHLALLHAGCGRLRVAYQTGRAAADLAEERGWSEDHRAAGAHLALALVRLEWSDLAAAAGHVEQALVACRATPWRPLELGAGIAHAWLRQAQGDPGAGVAVLDATREHLAGWAPPPWLRRWLEVTDAELRTTLGDTAGARRVLDGLERDDLDGAPWTAPTAVALAKVQLAEADPAGAAATLAPWLEVAAAAPSGPLVAAWLLDAVAAHALGDPPRVSRSLERALALAAPEGFRQRFAGAPARPLLAAHLGQPTAYRPFVSRLLDTSPPPQPHIAGPAVLVETLSERERVVLRFLPSRLSAAEIADELYLSVHTVKTHMRHVYRKLQATNRREAVNQARVLKLL